MQNRVSLEKSKWHWAGCLRHGADNQTNRGLWLRRKIQGRHRMQFPQRFRLHTLFPASSTSVLLVLMRIVIEQRARHRYVNRTLHHVYTAYLRRSSTQQVVDDPLTHAFHLVRD